MKRKKYNSIVNLRFVQRLIGTYLNPPFQTRMETEYFHARFSVWIVGWLEFKLCDAQLFKELGECTDQFT